MNEQDRGTLRDLQGRLEGMEIKGVSIDSRTIGEGELFVAIKGDRFDGHDFVGEAIKKGAWGALVDRAAFESRYAALGGIKNILPVEDTLYSLQEMSLMHRKKFSMPVIGVTGSNGKTTTKEMLASVLAQRGLVLKNTGNLNNHIGVPLTLLKLNRTHKSAVIEMGMSALGEIETLTRLARPDVGVITNIGAAHLEFLGSTDAVARAKGELLQNMRQDGTAVLNADDPYFSLLKSLYGGAVVTFGISRKADVTADGIRPAGGATDFTLRTDHGSIAVRLCAVGQYNVANALAAAAAAIAADVPLEMVRFGLEEFSPVAMRSEIKEAQGRTILADYYNANPTSVKAALETLAALRATGKKIVAVLGDMLELGAASDEAHRETGRLAARLGVDLLVVFGPQSRLTAQAATAAGMAKDAVVEAETHADAAAILRERTAAGDTVLIKGSRGMKLEKVLEEL